MHKEVEKRLTAVLNAIQNLEMRMTPANLMNINGIVGILEETLRLLAQEPEEVN